MRHQSRGPVAVFTACALLIVIFLGAFSVRGLTWVQTSEQDFLLGERSNLEVLPSGDLQLAQTPAGWVREGVVLNLGSPGGPDANGVRDPYVLKDGATYKMWYLGLDGTARSRLMYATSTDGTSWSRQGVVLGVQAAPYFFDSIGRASIIKDGGLYKLWFSGGFWTGGRSGGGWAQCYYAESADGVLWTIVGLALGIGSLTAWDSESVHSPEVVRDSTGRYWMYYQGWDGTSGGWNQRIGLATSTDGQTFSRTGVDPVLVLGPTGSWDSRLQLWVAVVQGSPWQMWYTGSDGTTLRIGRATAPSPYNWSKSSGNPEFVPGSAGSWDDAAVQGPRILVDGGSTFMYYTGSDGTNTRIGRAHMAPGYAASGSFLSQVLDAAGAGSVWNVLSANATVPAGTGILMSTRSGNVVAPDGSWSAWSSPVAPGTSPITSPRARYLQVRAEFSTSDAGSTAVLHDFSVSYEPNAVSAPVPISPVGGMWVNNSSPSLTWAYSDPEGDPAMGFRVQLSRGSTFAIIDVDSAVVLSPASSWRTPPLSDGLWYWRVQTVDSYGAWSPFGPSASMGIDTTPPATTHAFGTGPQAADFPPWQWVPPGTTFRLTSTDADSGIATTYLSIDGVEGPYLGPVSLSVHGAHTLEFWAVDGARNLGPRGRVEVLVDRPPSLANVAPAEGAWLSRSPAFSWSFEDPDGDPTSGFEVQVAEDPSFATLYQSSGVVSSTGQSWYASPLADATYFWRVRVRDGPGVWSPFGTVGSFGLDTSSPAVTLGLSPPPQPLGVPPWMWVEPGAVLTLAATDTGSGVENIHLSIDGTPGTYVGPVTLSAHGVHAYAFWADDVAGNVAPVQGFAILIDQAPAATNRAPGDQVWLSASPVVAWDFADPDGDPQGAFEVQVASDASFTTIVARSGNVSSEALEWYMPPLPDGTYFWRVHVQDAFGVWSPYSPARSFGLDTGSPVVTFGLSDVLRVIEVPPGALLEPGAVLTLSATDTGSGVLRIYLVIDGVPGTYTEPVTLSAHGIHTYEFWAEDFAGNLGPVQGITVLIDQVPAATNRAPGNQVWTTSSPTVAWDFSDPDQDAQGAFEVRVATDAGFATIVSRSGNVSSGASDWSVPSLSDGTYFWRVRVRDSFGVWSPWSSPTSFRLDSIAPVVRTVRGGVELTGIAILYVAEGFELTASDEGSGVERIEYSVDGGPWTPYTGSLAFGEAGRHSVAYRAVDVAGNLADARVLFVIVEYPANWTPIVAAVLAVVLAIAGALVAHRRTPTERSKAVHWLLLVGPATLIEAVIGVYSAVTGELAMPPWTGPGLVALLLVLIGGVVSLVAGALWTPASADDKAS